MWSVVYGFYTLEKYQIQYSSRYESRRFLSETSGYMNLEAKTENCCVAESTIIRRARMSPIPPPAKEGTRNRVGLHHEDLQAV